MPTINDPIYDPEKRIGVIRIEDVSKKQLEELYNWLFEYDDD